MENTSVASHFSNTQPCTRICTFSDYLRCLIKQKKGNEKQKFETLKCAIHDALNNFLKTVA